MIKSSRLTGSMETGAAPTADFHEMPSGTAGMRR
jgi:hypothetical protein